MNLLVTNTRNAQAYSIIRALRPYARKIVATMEGENRLAARLSHAANSRLVDKRYYTPSPALDWRAGRIRRENTPKEEAYIQAVLRICDEEKIDTIFPSFDPHMYVFSKNKKRFESRGVLIPVPDYEIVITPLDKYRTIKSAEEVGFPCPKTYLPDNETEISPIADELGFPLVIKPRFTSGGRGTSIVRNLGELSERMRASWKGLAKPMIQEYIPGREKQQFYFLLDQAGELKMAFCPKTHRLFDRLYRNSSLASEVAQLHPYAVRAAAIAQKLAWWGTINVQTKIDSRDGLPKLLELNPRLGNHLWYRTAVGINEPLMWINIAQRKAVAEVEDYAIGTMLLSPIEDLLCFGFWFLDRNLYTVRTRLLGRSALDPLNAPPSVKEMLRSYARTYGNGNKKAFDPYFRYCLQDPFVSMLWWLKYFYQVMVATKHLGR